MRRGRLLATVAATLPLLALVPVAGAQVGAFDTLVADAERAKQEGRLEDAAGLYRDAVRLRPDWADGHWALATLLYDLSRYEEASTHFGAVVTYQPENGTALALEGLSEVKLGNHERALAKLQSAFGLGIPNEGVLKATALHIALLVNRLGNPDVAQRLLGSFAVAGDDSPPVILAFGLTLLRRPLMIEEIPPEDREVVMLAGRGAYQMGRGRRTEVGRLALDELISRYPSEPGVHWAFGAYVQSEDPDRALLEFRRELAIQPDHYPSMLQMASIELQRGNLDQASELADRASNVAPESPAVRLLLGRVLLEKGDAEGAVAALEAGLRLVPESPDFYFSLARAYQQLGRDAEAAEARTEFQRLKARQSVPAPLPGQAPAGGTADIEDNASTQ